jgi:phosphate-selective porin OprO/OprP
MKKRWAAVIIGVFVAGGVLTPGLTRAEESLQDRFERLEQRYNILERKVENDEETVAAKAKEAPSVTANPGDGFTIKNPDKSFVLKFGGYNQLDGRFFLNDNAKTQTDTYVIRRARLWFDATLFNAVGVRIVPDFGGGATTLQDAWLNLNYIPGLQLRAGRFKVPFGLERLQSSHQTLFTETGHTTSLTPNYDIGLQLWGDLWGGTVNYALAHTNGVADGASADSDTSDGKAITARVFVHPFRSGGSLVWKDLGIGIAVGRDSVLNASTATATGLPTYRTPGQQSFLTYGNAVLDGDRLRWSPQAYWYAGRFGFLGEYVVSRADVKRVVSPITQATLTNRAWQTQVSYALTGETASYKGLKPLKPFGTKDGGGWGAWELAGRYSEFRADLATFDTALGATTGLYANKTTQAQRARTWSGGVNWYLNSFVKIQTNYDHTQFTGGATGTGTRKLPVREWITRFQVSF